MTKAKGPGGRLGGKDPGEETIMGRKLVNAEAARKAEMEKNKKKKLGILWSCIAGVVLLAAVLLAVFWPRPKAEQNGHYTAEIVVRDYGKITVELYPEYAPLTVKNFVELADSGFYDGLTFHRIMSGFMIQGGDPNGDGTGGSDHLITGEFAANGFPENTLAHTRGVISMARASSSYNSASSQFFIMHSDNNTLNGYYAAFGRVINGMTVVDQIASNARPTDNNGTIKPEDQPVITSIRITSRPGE